MQSDQQQPESSSFSILLSQIAQLRFSYSQKYLKWIEYLQKDQSEEQLLKALEKFLEQYPFNYQYWIKYAELSGDRTINPSKNITTLDVYEKYAVKRCCKSYQLWVCYLQEIKTKTQMKQNDPAKYKKQLQKAIIQVGSDCRSASFYQEYYELINESVKYEFYKKVMLRSLEGLQDLFQKFKKWIETEIDETLANSLYIKQTRSGYNSNNNSQQAQVISTQQKKQYLFEQIEKQYKKTLKHREKRLNIENKIKFFYFNATEIQKNELAFWKQLIELERQEGNVQSISYCYERCLMSHTEQFELWTEMFHYLEHETNKYMKVLSILRNNKTFFIKFSEISNCCDLYFYWCDLQERQNPNKTRDMYNELIRHHTNKNTQTSTQTTSNSRLMLRLYERFIQFQIRQKQFNSAKQLYDKMLEIFASEPQNLSYVLIEYSKFVLKHYKDYTYPKKLLQNYFEYEHMPYNSYLMIGYLEFMEHYKNNEGYYDQLMRVLSEAVKKAKKTLSEEQFNRQVKMIKYYLRSAVGSIYLIKMSERKIMEIATELQVSSQMVQETVMNNDGSMIIPEQ